MKRFLLAMLFFPSFALAQSADVPASLTLAEARDIALRNHPRLHSAEMNVKAAKQGIKIARSGYFPQVTGNAIRAWAGNGTEIAAGGTLASSSVLDRGSAGVGVSQLITDFGRTTYLVDAARAQADAQAARMLSERDQVLFRVTSAYYNVLRAEKIVKVAETTRDTRHTLFDQVSSLRNAKMKSDLDVGIAKQSLSAADLLVLQAHNDLDDAQAELSQALGYNTDQHFIVKDEAIVQQPPVDLDRLLEVARTQNPDLRAMHAQLQAATKQAKADESENYPTVSALGVAGVNPIRNNGVDASYAAAGINISIPFFTGGRITATEKRSAYQAEALKQDIADKENALVRDIRVSWNNMQAAYQNISVSEELRNTSTDALELTQARYNIGKSSIVDLAEVQLSETQAEIAYSNAAYTYLIDRALLEYKVGGSTLDEAAAM